MTLSSLHSTKGFCFASLLHSLPFYSRKGNGDDVGNVQFFEDSETGGKRIRGDGSQSDVEVRQ